MKIIQQPVVDVRIVFTISEREARALEALAGYGTKPFIDVFYRALGAHYMEPHEKGLATFLDGIRETVPRILGRLDKAREAFTPKPQPPAQEVAQPDPANA